jgi:hypothetical protein
MTASPSDVLDTYADLVRRLRHPAGKVADYMAYQMNRDLRANGKEGQFYPVVRGGLAQFYIGHGERFARTLAGQLHHAPVYQVTAEMCDAIEAMHARTAEQQGVPVIYQATLPSDAGFCWLDRPHTVTVDNSDYDREYDEPVQAVSWALHDVTLTEGTFPALRVTIWQATTATRNADGTPADPATIADVMAWLGPLTMLYSDAYAIDMPMATGQPGPGVTALALYLNMLWTMLGMEVAVADRATGLRGARRRAGPDFKNTDVLVVTLRRAQHHQPGGGHRDVEWTHRWLVLEHYRHRAAPDPWHHAIPDKAKKRCATCGGPVSYVAPYIKGPDGAPVLVRRRLNRLSR